MAGEDIWSGSSIAAFTALNYTQLYAFGGMDALLIYQYLPEVVDIVILDEDKFWKGLARNRTNYIHDNDEHTPGLWQDPDRIGFVKTVDYQEVYRCGSCMSRTGYTAGSEMVVEYRRLWSLDKWRRELIPR